MTAHADPARPSNDIDRPARNRVILVAVSLALVVLALPGLGPGGRADDTGGDPLDCPPCPDDGNQCTLEHCLNGFCVHDAVAMNRMSCDDGNKCTLNDTCEAGTCFPGNIPLNCNDNNPCTDDSCAPATGCVFIPRDHYCDDHNACTVGDWCVAGVCTATGSVTCDDGNVCTTDSCSAVTGCQHAPSAGTCDDASACTDGDHCEGGSCKGVTSCPCPDGDHDGWADCTVAGCDPTGIVCGDCDDGNPAVHPGAAEVCDQRDDDCDGSADEGFPRSFVAHKVVSPFAQDGAKFGASLAPIGDVNGDGVGDIAVGAPGVAAGTLQAAGAVAVLSGRDRSVLCLATDPAATANALLGSAVTGIGDVTGDHVPDFAAGAPGRSRVMLFSGADCAPLYACGDSQTVTWGNPQVGFSTGEGIVILGASLAAPGDVNGDGIPDLVAADPSSNQSSSFTHPLFAVGSISILSGASCQRIARATGSGFDVFGRFGSSMAVLPDITGDGIRDLAVGELASDATFRGDVRLVSGATAGTIRQLSDPASTLNDQFGGAVAPLRNAAGTSLLAIAVGAGLDDGAAGTDTGRIVIFDPAGAILRTCRDPEAAPGDDLGTGLAEIPDLNGDGVPEIAATAPLDDNDVGIDAGTVLVFSGADCTLMARLTDATGQAGARMGYAVARLADLDGDGADDLGVGSALDDAGGPDRGSIIVYTARSDCSASTPPPIAVATAPAVSECDRPGGALVNLDGSTSHADGAAPGEGITAFAWYEDYGLPGQRSLGTMAIVTPLLPTGDHTITLLVTNAQGLTGSDTLTVSVRDTHAPALSVLGDPFVLWPPNHEMVPVAVAWTLADLCDPSPIVTLVSVTSSEPDDADGTGDGRTTGDIDGADVGTADVALLLRAERSSDGAGRVYTLTYAATDASGNRATALGIVTVPHDQGSGPEPLLLRAGKTGAGDAVRLVWPAVPGASSYDVIRGDLGNWRFADGQVFLGPVTRLGAGVTGTTMDEPAGDAAPPVGAAWFYLIEFNSAGGPSGYGTESAPGPRVPE